jgi:legumain
MRTTFLILVLSFFLISSIICKNFKYQDGTSLTNTHYAVLIAGSADFYNYRHQSDVFHAYQLLISNGVPKDKIIVFAYDDIAHAKENPFKGKVFNRPDKNGPGIDVYAGVEIDYKGADVTIDNFKNVLLGNADKMKKTGTGRVLKSTKDDNVFIYYSDHGAAGMLMMPTGELFYADDLLSTLKEMHEKEQYKNLVFYLEACESGSMFEGLLPENINIYATTAAEPDQNSFAQYCPPDGAKVNKKNIGTCLGDEYSTSWLEDSESKNSLSETLQKQYEVVKGLVQLSNVSQYGQTSLGSHHVGEFQGNLPEDQETKTTRGMLEKIVKKCSEIAKMVKNFLYISRNSNELKLARKSAINAREVKLHYLKHRYETMNDEKSEKEYFKQLLFQEKVDKIIELFDKEYGVNREQKVKNIDFNCLRDVVNAYRQFCFSEQKFEYELKYARNFALACKNDMTSENGVNVYSFFEKMCVEN